VLQQYIAAAAGDDRVAARNLLGGARQGSMGRKSPGVSKGKAP